MSRKTTGKRRPKATGVRTNVGDPNKPGIRGGKGK